MLSESTELVAGRYKLVHQIGTGNMSTVYKGEDIRRGNQTVAVKLLNTIHEDELKKELFRRETKALEKLEHPNIIKIFDYGWAEERTCYYIILEYIPRTLFDAVQVHKNEKDSAWCLPLMRDLSDALIHAHSQGVIHRDLKPTNILITENGIPKLTDFGISFLKFELGTGMTVSSFWSIGFAAPEQRNNQPATESSDIYSLGCVFYYLLSNSSPPSNIITSEHIQALPIPRMVKSLIQRMVVPAPDKRFSGIMLRRQLETLITKYAPLPEVYFQVTEAVRKELFNQGQMKRSSLQEACEFLTEELGGDTPKEVHFQLAKESIYVLTENFRLVCKKDDKFPGLIITAIHVLYEAQLERQKNNAKTFRFLWQFVDRNGMGTLPTSIHTELNSTLNDIFDLLTTHRQVQQTAKTRRAARQDFTKPWDAVLNLQKTRLEAMPKLAYKHYRQEGNTITFTLSQAAPDDLSWTDSSSISLIISNQQRPVFIGYLMGVNGNEVQVTWVPTSIQNNTSQHNGIPTSGYIGLYQQEALVALERQHWALKSLITGVTVNPSLPDVLLNLSSAKFDAIDDTIEFYQQNLAADKKNAVKQALAARDVFLLQGPPGTGKTTTLAEIILQILKVKPDARILVSSQSNVAVNHILYHVAKLRKDQRTEIVRIGRAEKIGQGAEEWALEQRLDAWRTEVLARTDLVIKDLNAQMRQQQRQRKLLQDLPNVSLDDLEQCKLWLEELDSDFQELAVYENQQVALLKNITSTHQTTKNITETKKIDLQESELTMQAKINDIKSALDLIRSYLPDSFQNTVESSLTKEKERLYLILKKMLEPNDPNSRENKLLELVKGWRKIFGKQDDFAKPILERANIFAATCLITGSRYLKDQEFDWAIIDEAGRATAPELLVPLVRSRRAIIVGDERQLPPMLDEDLTDKELSRLQVTRESLTESLFATLVTQGREEQLSAVQMLTVQHRMHPAIGKLISTVFYDRKLEHGLKANERAHGLDWLPKAVVWFSTARLPKHNETRYDHGYYNRIEVQGIEWILQKLERTYYGQGETREVAIITPYNAQISELYEQVNPTNAFWRALKIEIATVDAFQGRDCDIVLYSTVRSNIEMNLGFLKDRRRLNVALSRARQLLIIVGDIWTLENGRAGSDGNPYQELIRYIRENPQDCLIQDLKME